MMNIEAATHSAARLLETRGISGGRLDAEVLLAHTLGLSRAGLLARFQEQLTLKQGMAFDLSIERRAGGEPVAYITGIKEFWGLPLAVSKDVLIPRPDTETLVEATLEIITQNDDLARDARRSISLLEIGTGSGAIACALASEMKNVHVSATDISPAALAVARHNAKRLGLDGKITFIRGDLFENVSSRFDFIVSNPPYIAENEREELAADIKNYEPALALIGGADGLDIIRRIIANAQIFLLPGGWLVLEMGASQADAVEDLLTANGYKNIRIIRDIARRPRVAAAC